MIAHTLEGPDTLRETRAADLKLAPRLASIQQLRGLAALGVVVFHVMESASHRFTVGAAGVDAFFVISGFIMWGLVDGREVSPSIFLFRRLARVAPPYWLATALICIAAAIKPNLFPIIGLDVASWMKSVLFIPYADVRGNVQPLLLQGWTLNYEIFFYVVFAGVLLLRRRLVGLTLIMAGLVALHGIGLRAGAAASVYTDPILLEFTAGAWLGAAHRHARLPGAKLGLAMLVVGVIALALLERAGYQPDMWRPLAWGAPALLIVSGALCLETVARTAVLRPLVTLGDWSYSLYLTHLLVLNAASVLAPRSFALYAVVGVSASVLAAAVYYRLVEKPLHLAVSRSRAPRLAAPAPVI